MNDRIGFGSDSSWGSGVAAPRALLCGPKQARAAKPRKRTDREAQKAYQKAAPGAPQGSETGARAPAMDAGGGQAHGRARRRDPRIAPGNRGVRKGGSAGARQVRDELTAIDPAPARSYFDKDEAAIRLGAAASCTARPGRPRGGGPKRAYDGFSKRQAFSSRYRDVGRRIRKLDAGAAALAFFPSPQTDLAVLSKVFSDRA